MKLVNFFDATNLLTYFSTSLVAYEIPNSAKMHFFFRRGRQNVENRESKCVRFFNQISLVGLVKI